MIDKAPASAAVWAQTLNDKYMGLGTKFVLRMVLEKEFDWRTLSFVSSFGAESAVLLHMASEINRQVDVIFLDTHKHFPETLEYRDQLVDLLRLTGVRSVAPLAQELKTLDPDARLFSKNPNLCCYLRRVLPLENALAGREAWITGRKHFQSSGRANVPLFETTGGRIKFNPLIDWSRREIEAYFDAHNLPRHPLAVEGFFSIGCAPCTTPTWKPSQARDGRWPGLSKTECGIHYEDKSLHTGWRK